MPVLPLVQRQVSKEVQRKERIQIGIRRINLEIQKDGRKVLEGEEWFQTP